MIEHVDRVPTKPNRYAVYDEDHNFLRYEYHERADEPVQAGNPFNKALQDEFLSASGTTAGTASALTLAQPGFVLKDGAVVRIKLHIDSGATPTLNINGTGAKAIASQAAKSQINSFAAGTWVTLTYSIALSAYVVQGFSDKLVESAGTESVYEFVGWLETPPTSVERQYMAHQYVAYRREDNTLIGGNASEFDIALSSDAGRTLTTTSGSIPNIGVTQMRVWHPTLGLVSISMNGKYAYGTNFNAPLTASSDMTLNAKYPSAYWQLDYVGTCLFAYVPASENNTGVGSLFGVRAADATAFQIVYTPSNVQCIKGFAYDGSHYYMAGNTYNSSMDVRTPVLYTSTDGTTWAPVAISSFPANHFIGLFDDVDTGLIYGVFLSVNKRVVTIARLAQSSPAIFSQIGAASFSEDINRSRGRKIANKFHVAIGRITGQSWLSTSLWFNATGDFSDKGKVYPFADKDSFYGYATPASGYIHPRTLTQTLGKYVAEYAPTVTGVASVALGWIAGTTIYLGFRPRWVIFMENPCVLRGIWFLSDSATLPEGFSLNPFGFTSNMQGSFVAGR